MPDRRTFEHFENDFVFRHGELIFSPFPIEKPIQMFDQFGCIALFQFFPDGFINIMAGFPQDHFECIDPVMVRNVIQRGIGGAVKIAVQNNMIRVFHGVYGINIENCWNGQKYALMKLGLIASPFTYAQEMSSLTDEAKKRVEKCLDEFKTELD